MNIETPDVSARGVSTKVRWAVFIALALLALAIRLPRLAERPMHTDESINAYITGELLAGEAFHYDPKDRHGPVLFTVAEPLVKLFGARKYTDLTETELRLTPVIVGSATILLFGAGVEMFGFIPCLVAALLFVFAPLPVYYSRYFIHETLFVATTLGLMLAGWRAWQKNSAWSAGLAGLCCGLLLACKETAVIHFFGLGLVMVCAWLLPPREKIPSLKIVGVAVIVCLAVSVVLFTWFGQNWAVFSDLWKAVSNFTARAGGEGHEKPFGYYFHLLDPTFVLMIVAVGGGYAAICEAVSRTRKTCLLMAIYGLAVFLIYSAIPYKTPWLALNIWLPLAFVCGFGVEAFWDQMKNAGGRWFVGVAGVFMLAVLGAQTKLYAFDQPADEKNPYAYAHTVDDLLGLPPRIAELAKKENLTQPRIAVIAADTWPLPWYLRNFPRVGYWQPGQDPGPQDFYITTTDVPESLDERLKNFDS
ncbi:MAG TPA: flippase activity-associated protein Agl23, partial [Verrucomicrobiae bacterium]|nr:flippase activity-associated protein Agl23 [Verrucomicrobiae bacterium]